MSLAVKETMFEEYQQTLIAVSKHIDDACTHIKNRQKNLSVWKGFESYSDFLKNIEKSALKMAADELQMTIATIKNRWQILTLPAPVYCAIEAGEISFSKVKPLTVINFDFENDNDIEVASEIVEEIKKGLTLKEIKKVVEAKQSKVWNKSTIVMERLLEQNGITADTKC